MLKGFNVIALDKDFDIVSLLRYSNLQWSRKYHESGMFSIEIPLEQYDPSYKYIYTNERPEVGEISQVNYIAKSNYKVVNLSGYFLEHQLNRRVVYGLGTTNITNAPSWLNATGPAESVAYKYFNTFKDLTYKYNSVTYTSTLGINTGTDLKRGHASDHERDGSYLGDKIYTILKPSSMSYRVSYDFETSKKVFSVWTGLDRTDTNVDGNNPIIFSTKYGNIKNPNVLIDSTDYKNCYIVTNSYNNSGSDVVIVQSNCLRSTSETSLDDNFVYIKSSVNKSDYRTQSEWESATHADAKVQMDGFIKTINVEFDALTGSYEYMVDFDIGDRCSIEIAEIGLSLDVVLIGCYEVIKEGTNTLTMEFGTPIIKYK